MRAWLGGQALFAFAVLFLSPTSLAAERFYQVIGPDGRPQTIVSPEGAADDNTSSTSADRKGAGKGFWNWLKKDKADTRTEVIPLADAPSAPASPPPGWAPYDGEQYLDSEILESTNFNPEKKSRFYLLNDGSRVRVEEHLAADEEAGDEPVPLFAMPVPDFFPFRYLPDEYREAPWQESVASAQSDGCFPADDWREAKALRRGQLAGVLMDKMALMFVKPGQVLESFSLEPGEGRSLIVSSYAATERKPSFGRPLLALADEKGCIRRVLSGYFQVRFDATKTRYARLEAEIKLLPDESRVFLVVPPPVASPVTSQQAQQQTEQGAVAGEAYLLSRHGKLGIRWVR